MPSCVLCFAYCLVFAINEVVQTQLEIDGNSGLKRGVHLQGAENQVSYGNFGVDKFHRLQVSVGSSITVRNYKECALSCVDNPPCFSFIVASSPLPDGKFQCELLNEDKYSASPSQLVSSQEYHHYSIKVFRESDNNPYVRFVYKKEKKKNNKNQSKFLIIEQY